MAEGLLCLAAAVVYFAGLIFCQKTHQKVGRLYQIRIELRLSPNALQRGRLGFFRIVSTGRFLTEQMFIYSSNQTSSQYERYIYLSGCQMCMQRDVHRFPNNRFPPLFAFRSQGGWRKDAIVNGVL
jgi:hypothetical protein